MSDAHRTYAWRKAADQRKAVARANNEHCVRCGQPIDYALSSNARRGATIDHLDSLQLGGDLVPPQDMLAPAHRECNSRHGALVGNSVRSNGGGARSTSRSTSSEARSTFSAPTASPRPKARRLAPESHPGNSASPSNIDAPFSSSPRTRPSNAGFPLIFPPPHPEAVGSHGDAAVAWIEARMKADPNAEGDHLLWWQWLVLQRSQEYRADGSLCWPMCLLKAPRQQGKSVILCELAMWRAGNAALFGEVQRVLHAARVAALADQQQMAVRSWADSQGLTGSRRKADSYIEWPDGSHWHVMALGAVWGQRVGLALLDEGWDMSPGAFWNGLWPAMAQRKARQAWVFSASNEGDKGLMASMEKSDHCLTMVWGAPADADPTDEATWHAASPHMTPERHQAMRVAVTAPGFRTEWLNIQPIRRGTAGWLPDWGGCGVAQGDPSGGIGAVEVSHDRSVYGAAIACRREDDAIDVWTAAFPDLDGAAAWLGERGAAVVLAGLSLKDQIVLPVEVQGVGVKETRHATPILAELVRNGRVRHDNGTAVAEQLSVARVTSTEYGDVLSAKASDGPIPTAKAVAWSVWAAATSAVAVEQPAIW